MRPSLHADANVHDMAQTSLLHLTHGASAVASLVEKGETEAKLSMSMSMSDFSLGFFSGRMWSKELVSPKGAIGGHFLHAAGLHQVDGSPHVCELLWHDTATSTRVTTTEYERVKK